MWVGLIQSVRAWLEQEHQPLLGKKEFSNRLPSDSSATLALPGSIADRLWT